ncbi:CC-adding tRNA nucleotidyltransferase-like isoform X2 [Triticum dicoccoides]|uniref:CC-adding tRNA nucleotidyltransferase-like isoform X2 n=1 Tax=Triticum dicoccoides TaxID=85692 RepID=UPI00188E3CD2|nr:CC-adding tRNA nucleotidyltransferase-like isoform X2 [Triticum dicoccoides]
MTAVRRCTDLSSLPSPAPLLSRLSSAASRLLQMRKYGSRKEDGGRLRNGRSSSASRPGFIDPSSWKYFDSRAVGIPAGAIPRNCMTVLQMLKRKGFEAYLVGGCVRDLLLKRAPKDFDVITTASLKQVSSFKTNTTQVKGNENVNCSEETDGHDEGDILLWKDSLRRDFTVNSLFFNPFNYRVYDYVNGVKDLRKNKVCTVIPAHVSFKEDPARILRGLRVAARLGFQFSSETSTAIRDLSPSIIDIDKTRLAMEMKYMLSYGAAESSIRLLRKYGLLDILLPFQAAYLSDQLKGKSSDRGLMLMNLLANLDKFFSADRPCHCSLWLALLAFHNALVNSPQDAQVIKAFAALMHFGTWDSAIEFLNEDVGAPVTYVPEAFGRSGAKVDNLMERTSHLVSLVKSSVDTLTCLNTLKQSVVRYPGASQFSGLVFVSAREKGRVLGIFNGLDSDLTSYDKRRGSHGIDYKLLEDGVTAEVRFVLGKVIMDTMSAESPCASTDDAAALPRAAADVTDADHRPLSMLFRSGESE